MKRAGQTTIYLSEEDERAILDIRRHYGVVSTIDSIRISLRELQRRIAANDRELKNEQSKNLV